jgi:hypothetical protein
MKTTQAAPSASLTPERISQSQRDRLADLGLGQLARQEISQNTKSFFLKILVLKAVQNPM